MQLTVYEATLLVKRSSDDRFIADRSIGTFSGKKEDVEAFIGLLIKEDERFSLVETLVIHVTPDRVEELGSAIQEIDALKERIRHLSRLEFRGR
jgi:hypothetical protein